LCRRVEQSKLQEAARQQVTLQELERQKLEAQLKVIEQERINAQAQLELTKVQQQVAQEQAKVDLAKDIALAKLYADNPAYVSLLVAQANASAIQASDKFIFVPAGTFPNLVFGNGVVPTVNIPQQQQPQ
jgi:hypothetical protein